MLCQYGQNTVDTLTILPYLLPSASQWHISKPANGKGLNESQSAKPLST